MHNAHSKLNELVVGNLRVICCGLPGRLQWQEPQQRIVKGVGACRRYINCIEKQSDAARELLAPGSWQMAVFEFGQRQCVAADAIWRVIWGGDKSFRQAL
jgi:hypothetical protein